MIEPFCIGFVIGVLIARVQPLLFAAFRKWRNKPSKQHERIKWTFREEPLGFSYMLVSNGILGPLFVAKIQYKNSNPIGYYDAQAMRSHGSSNELVWCNNMTFEQACAWVKDCTGIDGPDPVHLSKNRND